MKHWQSKVRAWSLDLWLHAFHTTIDTDVCLWRLVRNNRESQELKTVSKNPSGNKDCQKNRGSLAGPFEGGGECIRVRALLSPNTEEVIQDL